jgi:hypothetical protein
MEHGGYGASPNNPPKTGDFLDRIRAVLPDLIAQAHRNATESRIKAAEALESERIRQVKFGSALEENLIDSRAQHFDNFESHW